MTEKELNEDRARTAEDYRLAYGIVRQAMSLYPEPDLQSLRNALYFAHCFVNEELDEMEEKAKELGLDVWITRQAEDDAQEEQERLDQEEWEREEQEELKRLDAQWSQYDSDVE